MWVHVKGKTDDNGLVGFELTKGEQVVIGFAPGTTSLVAGVDINAGFGAGITGPGYQRKRRLVHWRARLGRAELERQGNLAGKGVSGQVPQTGPVLRRSPIGIEPENVACAMHQWFRRMNHHTAAIGLQVRINQHPILFQLNVVGIDR